MTKREPTERIGLRVVLLCATLAAILGWTGLTWLLVTFFAPTLTLNVFISVALLVLFYIIYSIARVYQETILKKKSR